MPCRVVNFYWNISIQFVFYFVNFFLISFSLIHSTLWLILFLKFFIIINTTIVGIKRKNPDRCDSFALTTTRSLQRFDDGFAFIHSTIHSSHHMFIIRQFAKFWKKQIPIHNLFKHCTYTYGLISSRFENVISFEFGNI